MGNFVVNGVDVDDKEHNAVMVDWEARKKRTIDANCEVDGWMNVPTLERGSGHCGNGTRWISPYLLTSAKIARLSSRQCERLHRDAAAIAQNNTHASSRRREGNVGFWFVQEAHRVTSASNSLLLFDCRLVPLDQCYICLNADGEDGRVDGEQDARLSPVRAFHTYWFKLSTTGVAHLA